MRNRTEHGFSRLTAISDAGSTPAASTNLLRAVPWSAVRFTLALALLFQSTNAPGSNSDSAANGVVCGFGRRPGRQEICGGIGRGMSKVEKRRFCPVISDRSSSHNSLGILR